MAPPRAAPVLRARACAFRVLPEPAPAPRQARLSACTLRVSSEPAPLRVVPKAAPCPTRQLPTDELRVGAEPRPIQTCQPRQALQKRLFSTLTTSNERVPAETEPLIAHKKKICTERCMPRQPSQLSQASQPRQRSSKRSATFIERVPAETEVQHVARPGSSKAELRQVHVDTGIIAAAALRSSSDGVTSHWAEHGCDPSEVKKRLRACVCKTRQCYSNLRFDSVMGLLTSFWKLSHAEQDSFLFTCFASAEDRASAESGASDITAVLLSYFGTTCVC